MFLLNPDVFMSILPTYELMGGNLRRILTNYLLEVSEVSVPVRKRALEIKAMDGIMSPESRFSEVDFHGERS